MTFRTERVYSLVCTAAAAVLLPGFAACTADNVLGIDTGPPDDGGNNLPATRYFALSYDPATDQLLVGTDHGVTLFQAGDGGKLRAIAADGDIYLARRAGGLITASNFVQARIFDEGGNLLRTIVHPPEGVCSLDLAPDGRTIMTSYPPGRVRFVDTGTGAQIDTSLPWRAEYPGPPPCIYDMRFSPDGDYLASPWPGTRIWRVSDGAVWADIPGYGKDIAVSAAGEIARIDDTAVDVFAVPSGAQVASYPTGGFPPIVAYSADGTRLALSVPDGENPGGVVSIIDRVNGAEAVKLIDDPQTRSPDFWIVALAFAGPDRIAVAWDDGRLAAFRLSDGALVWSRVD